MLLLSALPLTLKTGEQYLIFVRSVHISTHYFMQPAKRDSELDRGGIIVSILQMVKLRHWHLGTRRVAAESRIQVLVCWLLDCAVLSGTVAWLSNVHTLYFIPHNSLQILFTYSSSYTYPWVWQGGSHCPTSEASFGKFWRKGDAK